MFGKKKEKRDVALVKYDPETMTPVLKCSICNGEQVAGFKDKKTGHFMEVAFIRSDAELQEFLKTYGIDSIPKEY